MQINHNLGEGKKRDIHFIEINNNILNACLTSPLEFPITVISIPQSLIHSGLLQLLRSSLCNFEEDQGVLGLKKKECDMGPYETWIYLEMRVIKTTGI
jgi:hypothetical protein